MSKFEDLAGELQRNTKVKIVHHLVYEVETTLAMYWPDATVQQVVDFEANKDQETIVFNDVYEDIEHVTVKKTTIKVIGKDGTVLHEDDFDHEEDK